MDTGLRRRVRGANRYAGKWLPGLSGCWREVHAQWAHGHQPRVLGALTRNNLFGREQSASVQGNYGLLEQEIDLVYDNPHLWGNRNFDLTFTGGYANSQDVTTYVASRIEAGYRLTEKVNGSRFGAVARQHVHLWLRLPPR